MNNQYKYIYDGLESTPLSEVENTKDGTETLLVGKVEDMKIRSSTKNGVFIKERLAAMGLKDSQGRIDIVVFQDNLKKLQKMNLHDDIVFQVMITDYDFLHGTIKKIQVLDIININEVVKCKI